MRTLALAITRGALVHTYTRKPPLAIVLETIHEGPLSLLMATYLLKADSKVVQTLDIEDQRMAQAFYWYLRYYISQANIDYFDPFVPILFNYPATSYIIHRACLNSDMGLVSSLLRTKSKYSRLDIHISDHLVDQSWWYLMTLSCIMEVLHSFSKEREEIVMNLLQSIRPHQSSVSSEVLLRCIQLRAWNLATEISTYNKNKWPEWELDHFQLILARYVKRCHLLHLCASCSDVDGLEFLFDALRSADIQNLLSTPGSIEFENHTPLQFTLASLLSGHPVCENAMRSIMVTTMMMRKKDPHGSEECGEAPNNCKNTPFTFFVDSVRILLKLDTLTSRSPTPQDALFLTEDRWKLYLKLLEGFMRTWVQHFDHFQDPKVLLLQILKETVDSFRKMESEIAEAERVRLQNDNLPADLSARWTRMKRNIAVQVEANTWYHVKVAEVLLRSLTECYEIPHLFDYLDQYHSTYPILFLSSSTSHLLANWSIFTKKRNILQEYFNVLHQDIACETFSQGNYTSVPSLPASTSP